ncbi:MAG: class SAM-dependent methyltransferase, partial [Conexibacter sp.]|nr:class SAM-dependent methyltransferase [Conexibacter sp.]
MSFNAPAEAYDRFIGRYSAELARALMGVAGVQAGERALDVGCGPGGLTSELVALLGAGSVAAVDPSASFAAACRERLPGVDVQVAAGEALPFADASFDRVLAQLAINFMDDPVAGAAEMARVVRGGGSVAAAVWDYAGEMTLLRAFWDAATALDPGAAARDEGRAMPCCTPPELRELWAGAGLRDVAVAPVVVGAGYDDFEDLWAPLELGVGPAGAYTAGLAPQPRAALKDELRRRLGAPGGP